MLNRIGALVVLALAMLTTASEDAAAGFLKLTRTAFIQAEDEFANRGTCRDNYRNGAYRTRLEWTQFKWYDEAKLKLDITDRTYATLMAGSGEFIPAHRTSELYSNSDKINFGTTMDCRGPRTPGQLDAGKEGVVFIDLRGTNYKIKGATERCTATCSDCRDVHELCGQWALGGWKSAMSIECTNDLQRCTVKCGGDQGYCWVRVSAPRLKPTLSLPAASRACLNIVDT